MDRAERTGLGARALDALFLVSLLGGVAIYVFLHVRAGLPAALPPWLFGAGTAVLVVLWFLLSWERDAGWARTLLSLVFAVLACVVTLDTIGSGAVGTLAMANLVFVCGLRVAAGYIVFVLLAELPGLVGRNGPGLITAAWLVFIVLAYGAVLVLAEIVRRSREDKRLTESLYDQLGCAHRELAERAERIRELTVAAERARFARDMHDSVGHHLTVIGLSLRTAERLGPERADEAWREVAQARDLAGTALEETRRTVRALRPLPIGRGGLDEALGSLVDSFCSSALDLRFEASGSCADLDEDVAAVLYRSAQEGVSNVVRHSAATRARVELRVGPEVELSVLDDGPARTGEGTPGAGLGGSGLAGLRERATELGGVAEAGPSGAGFALRVRLPSTARRPVDAGRAVIGD